MLLLNLNNFQQWILLLFFLRLFVWSCFDWCNYFFCFFINTSNGLTAQNTFNYIGCLYRRATLIILRQLAFLNAEQSVAFSLLELFGFSLVFLATFSLLEDKVLLLRRLLGVIFLWARFGNTLYLFRWIWRVLLLFRYQKDDIVTAFFSYFRSILTWRWVPLNNGYRNFHLHSLTFIRLLSLALIWHLSLAFIWHLSLTSILHLSFFFISLFFLFFIRHNICCFFHWIITLSETVKGGKDLSIPALVNSAISWSSPSASCATADRSMISTD